MPNPYDQLRSGMREDMRNPIRGPIPGINPADHRGERPNVFARLRVLFFVAVTIAALMATAIGELGIVGPVLTARDRGTRHDDAPLNDLAAAEPSDAVNARVYAATQGMGVFRYHYHPKSAFWDRIPADKLPTNNVVGIEIDKGLIAYVCQEGADGPRGLALSNVARDLKDIEFWKPHFLDTSSFDAAKDGMVNCVEWFPGSGKPERPDQVLVGTEKGGIGRYCPATRQWLKPPIECGTAAVRDILREPSGQALVATDAGIAVLAPDALALPDKKITEADGLLSDNILRLARRGDEVWYITMRGGLGRFRMAEGGAAGQFATLVGENGLPELDLPNIQFVSVDERGRIWVAYNRKDQGNIGLYRHDTHEWLGLADKSLPRILWFEADRCRPGAPAGGGAGDGAVLLIGTLSGVSSVREALDRRSLVLGNHGPNEPAQEVHSTPGGVWAHLEAGEGAARRARVALVGRAEADPSNPKWPWRNFFGPRSFSGLADAHFRSALRWEDRGKDRILVGTDSTDKLGIGEYHQESREFVPLWAPRKADGEPGLRHPNVLGLVPWGEGSVGVVTGDEALDTIDIAKGTLTPLLSPSALTADPSKLTGAAAKSDTLLLAGGGALMRYSLPGHNWQELASNRKLEDEKGQLELFFGAGALWAVVGGQLLQGTFQGDKVLWDDTHRTVRHRRHWQDEEALVILDSDGKAYAYTKDGDKGQWATIVAPTKWAGPGQGPWTVAATDGKKLLVGPMDKALAEYSFANHAWARIELPANCDEKLSLLALTPNHRWVLDSKGKLFAQATAPGAAWAPVAEGIERASDLSCDGHKVCFLQRGTGCVGFVDPDGNLEPTSIVGPPIEGAGDILTATSFEDDIFVATKGPGGRVARYNIRTHGWATFPANDVSDVVQFAHTQQFLYARSADGQVRRFSQPAGGLARWELVNGGRAALAATDMAGAGDAEVYLKLASGEVVSIADNANGQAKTQLAATKLGIVDKEKDKGKVTAAVEHGQALIVGTDGQGVWAYQPDADGVRRWSQAAAGHQPAATWSVTSLLAPSGPNDKWLAVVTADAVHVLGLQPTGQWAFDHAAFQGEGVTGLDARIAGNDLCITYQPADGGGRRVVRQPIAGGNTTVLVGDRLPAPVGDTRAVGVTEGGDTVFRADSAGPVGRYTRAQGSWAIEQGLSHVRSFPESLKQLWAWSPKSKSLHRLDQQTGKWAAQGIDDGKVTQVAWDADGMLVRGADDAIYYRTQAGQNGDVVLPAPSVVFKAAPEKLNAVAEFDGRLFVAVPGEPLQEYSLGAHAWKAHPGLTDCVDLAFAPGGKAPLFALTKDGKVHQMPPQGNGFAAVAVPDQRPVEQLVVSGDSVVGRCKNGDLVGLFPWEAPSLLLAQVGVPGKGPFEVTAAAEAGGKLLLGLHAAKAESLAVFDPAAMKWSSAAANGEVRRILKLQDPQNPNQPSVWVCEAVAGGGGTMCLRRVGMGNGGPTLDKPSDPILDAAEHKGEVFVVTDKHYLKKLNPVKNALDPVAGIGDRALPEDPKAPGTRHAVAARFTDEGVLAAILDNGELWHYDLDDPGWHAATLAPPAQTKITPQFIGVSKEKNHYAFQAADGRLYEYDRAKKTWVPILRKDPGGNTVLENPEATAPTKQLWDIDGAADKANYKATLPDGKLHELKLNRENDGRFDFDRFRGVAVDEEYIWLETEKGVWKFPRQQQGGARRKGEFVSAPRPDLFKKDGLEFAGPEFALKRGEGHWTLPGGKAKADLSWNRLGATPASRSTRPHERDPEGLGFAHLHALGLAAAGGQLYADTPGGIVAFKTQNGLLSLKGVVTDENEAAVAATALKAASSIERCNPFLTTWVVKPDSKGTPKLHLKLADKEPKAVSFTQKGFGFDQAIAMEFDPKAPNALVFHTVDGKMKLARNGQARAINDLETEFKGIKGAEPAEIAREDGSTTLYLYREDAEGAVASAQKHTGQAWQPEDVAEEVKKLLPKLHPNLVDAHGWKWAADDKVVLTLPALNGGQATPVAFDKDLGRFTHDVVQAIEASGAELHAATEAGLAAYGANGLSELFTPAAKGAGMWVGPKDKKLFARLPNGEAVERVPGKWQGAKRDEAEASKKDHDAWLLMGEAWRVSRANPLEMETPLVPTAKDFHKVSIKPGEAFDFEDVKDLQSLPDELHLATRFGLVSVDPATHQPTDVRSAQDLGNDSMAREKGTVFVRVQAGKVLQRQATAKAWQDGTEAAFARAQQVLFDDAKLWSVRRGEKGGVAFLFQYSGAKVKEAVAIEKGRFAFDNVDELIHQTINPWFRGPAGLLRRDITAPTFVEKNEPKPGAQARCFFRVALEEKPECYLRAADGTYRLAGAAWQKEKDADAKAAESLADTQVAKGPTWHVLREDKAKGAAGPVRVELRVGDDPYKPVQFSADKGLFTFDVLNDVVADWSAAEAAKQLRILLATDGGVAAYDLKPTMAKLFCQADADGIGPEAVDRVVDGCGRKVKGEDKVGILARVVPAARGQAPAGGQPRYLKLDAANKWTPLGGDAAAIFSEVEDLLTCDGQGWTAKVSGNKARPVAIEWKFQPVSIAASGQPDSWRFAHDMLRFAARGGDKLWLGTRGGVVSYPLATAEGGRLAPDLASPTIHSEHFLSQDDLAAAKPPEGCSVLYWDEDAKAVLAKAGASPSIFKVADAKAAPANEEVAGAKVTPADAAEAARFRKLAEVLATPFWTWSKASEAPVDIAFAAGKADLPEKYGRILDGKLNFARVEHQQGHKLHEATMAVHRDSLFIATRGGIVKCDPKGTEIEKLYAQLHTPNGPKPLLDVAALLLDTGKLYAKTVTAGEVAVFDPAADRWVASDHDPFTAKHVIAEDELLAWSRLPDGKLSLAFAEGKSDLQDSATYPFFTDGRFSFDPVKSFVHAGETLWLAGQGGIRKAGPSPGIPAYTFIDDFRPRPVRALRALPESREVIAVPPGAASAEILARTRDGTPYQLGGGGFAPSEDKDKEKVAAAFDEAYTKVRPGKSLTVPRLHWIQTPESVYAKVEAEPKDVLILGGPAGEAPLFSRGRLSLDDVRGAHLSDGRLVLTTAGGVCQYTLNGTDQSAGGCLVYGHAKSAEGKRELLAGLESIESSEGRLMAWDGKRTYIGGDAKRPGALQWEPAPAGTLNPSQRRVFTDSLGTWRVERTRPTRPSDPAKVTVTLLPNGTGAARSYAITSFAVGDLARATQTEDFLWLPMDRGFLWLHKEVFRRTTARER